MSGTKKTRPASQRRALPQVEQIVAGFERICVGLRSQAWADAGARHLTPTQQSILLLLGEAPLGISQLAQRLELSLATVSHAVSTLEAKRLLVKSRAALDRRALQLRLSEAGELELARIAAAEAPLPRAIRGLGAPQQAGLLAALIEIIAALQTGGSIAVAQMCVSCRFFRPAAHPGEARPHHCAFVDAPLAALELRVQCAEHEAAPAEDAARALAALREPAVAAPAGTAARRTRSRAPRKRR